MITEKELQAVELSPTKRDFYQVWNELLDTASKLSERWDPASTNESDPGIVLLKVLTGVADKLNYTIDKKILEAFMPSATERDSMIKLCEMLGYDMKYYQSAMTDVTISYVGNEPLTEQVEIPAYTNIKNDDDDINFVTLKPVTLSADTTSATTPAIEGELVYAEDRGKVTIDLLDDNNRYYLPETQVAENGIFISYEDNNAIGEGLWERVTNLNTQPLEKRCFKFGYNSKIMTPYIQFPDDISSIIGNGVVVRYIRTNGVNGNISARTLTTMTKPEAWSASTSDEPEGESTAAFYEETNYSAFNASAAINGKNPETLNQAYNNYKKTIGTFDTLVTCRDYMNKIYMLVDENTSKPYVSNIIVSDIRDDINRSMTLCTFGASGIKYLDMPKPLDDNSASIEHFDLMLYPFKTYSGFANRDDYKNSFKYSDAKVTEITQALENYKTISHNFRTPDANDIVCIKNYLRLKAKIATTYKVNAIEESIILSNIYAALYDAFNMRNIDFGEEIPFDMILETIQNADPRIKNVSLDEPDLLTKICTTEDEYDILSDETGKSLSNDLVLKNVLAGRISLFKYDTDFEYTFEEQTYEGLEKETNIVQIETGCKIPLPTTTTEQILTENEVIMFRRQALKTEITYPAWINYYMHLESAQAGTVKAVAAKGTELTGNKRPKSQADIEKEDVYIADKTSSPVGKFVGYINGDETNRYKFKPAAGTTFEPDADKVKYYEVMLGEDGTTTGIPANTEYQLQEKDYLCINYSSSKTDENGQDTKEIHNEVYKAGDIIKPNFELVDSETWKTIGHSFSKKEGFLFVSEYMPKGMFTMDSTQQIEIRKPDETELTGNWNIYWNRNDDAANANSLGRIEFKWEKIPGSDAYHYILKTGEYLYFTDQYKNNLGYYGNGTELFMQSPISFKKQADDGTMTADAIINQGMSSEIPWIPVTFGGNKVLKIKKYQYTNLSEHDKLAAISFAEESKDTTAIGNEWLSCAGATYNKCTNWSKDSSACTWAEAASLDPINVKGIHWEVRSLLELKVGPDHMQTLNKDRDSLILTFEDGTTKDIEAKPQVGDVSFKANYYCMSADDTTDTSVTLYDTDGSKIEGKNDFTLKFFKYAPADFGDNESTNAINFNNFGRSRHWTKVVCEEDWAGKDFLKLNVMIPEGKYGLVMIYYVGTDGSNGISVLLNGKAVKRFNSDEDSTLLKNGINILQLDETGTLVFTAGTTGGDTIIFGKNMIVDGINPQLGYNGDLNAALAQLKGLDPELQFYYNAPIDNSLAVDINEFDLDEKLTSPLNWYDPNNVANKFVISEIDADYLVKEKGIQIAKSSKL